jgi:flagellar motor component MotA
MIGLAIGTVASYVAGMIIHSDNLPFLLALGSLVRVCGGLTAAFILAQARSRRR